MKEKLIELLTGKSIDTAADVEYVADFLLENGVIVLPCKTGTEIFLSDYPEGHHRLKEYAFCGDKIVMVIESWEFQRTCKRFLSEFGVTVFITRKEAEAALKPGLSSANKEALLNSFMKKAE